MPSLDKFKFFRELNYLPHPGQRNVHEAIDECEYVFCVCGFQSGKSIVCVYEIVYRVMEAIINGRNFKCWVCAPTYSHTAVIIERLWEIFHNKQGLNFKAEKWILSGSSIKNLVLRFPNGSFIKGKTTENPDSLIGEDLDLLILDEACLVKDGKRIFNKLQSRVLARKGKLITISTPIGQDYIYDLWIQAKTVPGWASFRFKTEDNPIISKEYLDRIKATIDPETYSQDYEASFIIKAGRFFGEFTEENLKKWKYDPNLECALSIDFGYRHPVIQWIQIDKDNNVYIFDEFCIENTQTDALINVVKSKPYYLSARYADPAGNSINAQTGMSDILKFENAQLELLYSFDSYDRSVKEGSKIIRGKIKNCYGERSLFVDPDKCPMTTKAFFNCTHDKATGKYKKDGWDNYIDCARYFFVNRFRIEEDSSWVGGYY